MLYFAIVLMLHFAVVLMLYFAVVLILYFAVVSRLYFAYRFKLDPMEMVEIRRGTETALYFTELRISKPVSATMAYLKSISSPGKLIRGGIVVRRPLEAACLHGLRRQPHMIFSLHSLELGHFDPS